VLSICRALQTPPRDDVKLLALFAATLRHSGREPRAHIVVVRDFLAACTLVRRDGWSPSELARVRAVIAAHELTPVWFPGIRDDEINQPDALPDGDWLHRAAKRLFASEASAARFVHAWPYDVRPPTDDRPFFLDFFRWHGFSQLRRTFGAVWLTRVELAFPFVLAALALTAVAGALGLLTPLFLDRQRLRGRAVTCAYFTALGLGYLLVELAALSRLIRAFGDPVIAASVTLAVFLLASGFGGLWAVRHPPRLPLVAVAVALGVLVEMPLLGRVGAAGAVALLVPLAFGMGMPMPLGLARLDEKLVPWA